MIMTDLRKLALRTLAGLALAGSVGGAAFAHHSYSMFDRNKTITIEGAVRAWEMTNPHSYLWVTVMRKDGVTEVWGMEGAGVSALQRAGVRKSEVKPGDKVKVNLHPLRDGRTGGQLVSLVLDSTGRVVNFGGGGGQPGRPDGAEGQ
ncbi:DUF6152 family protein [Phenylobacterium aquaticum]|uniref:DUF6152 family protein n=1 Tax=Phenylobacterium aquaticum TaxID=1763816 RepID=UPI001F5C9C94|nr:DUF6152 family protein [Phenylobacterium aquaticum]MCI3135188.1 DUF6152 family protein [Phenylobacterium aquaticum]